MCLMAMAWGMHPRLPLVLAANRDEFHDRQATPMAWWDDGHTLAGQDLQAGGTWFGLSRHGRIGLLTNVREPGRQQADLPSRGALVPLWLKDATDADDMSQRLRNVATNGYNLLGIDLMRAQAHCWSNRHGDRHALDPGIYGLSNAALDTPWPKLQRLKEFLSSALDRQALEELQDGLLQALADRAQPEDASLPQTGVSLDWERCLSRIFIETPDGRYGTRCSTVVVVEHTPPGQWQVHAVEQSWNSRGEPTQRVAHRLFVEGPAAPTA
jgi:uncharacterized protein with NRDE domain